MVEFESSPQIIINEPETLDLPGVPSSNENPPAYKLENTVCDGGPGSQSVKPKSIEVEAQTERPR